MSSVRVSNERLQSKVVFGGSFPLSFHWVCVKIGRPVHSWHHPERNAPAEVEIHRTKDMASIPGMAQGDLPQMGFACSGDQTMPIRWVFWVRRHRFRAPGSRPMVDRSVPCFAGVDVPLVTGRSIVTGLTLDSSTPEMNMREVCINSNGGGVINQHST